MLCILVDDHEDTREGYAEYLRVSGIDVRAAASGAELEGLLGSVTPDAIVLDLQLPHVDGWELAKRIRADERLRRVPLLAVSACVMPADRARAEQVGFDRFLSKPCDPDVMVAELRSLISAEQHDRSPLG